MKEFVFEERLTRNKAKRNFVFFSFHFVRLVYFPNGAQMRSESPKFVLSDVPAALSSFKMDRNIERELEPVLKQMPKLTEQYRPWRKFRFVAADLGLDPEGAWAIIKFFQTPTIRQFDDLRLSNGRPFVFVNAPQVQEALHRVDRGVGGKGPAALDADHSILGDIDSAKRLRIKTWMDEAAESSLIEGASGTRKQATDLLRSGRAPKSRGERMIVNNYTAMLQIKRWLDSPLTPEMLLELQAMLTEGTLKDPGEAGRFRMPGERVDIIDERDNSVIYIPPPADGLRGRLDALCRFANTIHKDAAFLHPVIKASILHFMIGYEHPFCDGNGRTARAVFYWFALKYGYSIFEYMPISERIRVGFAKYPQAYLDVEHEGGDLTHFVLYKLDIIEQSLDRFALHLDEEESKLHRAQRLLKASKKLNIRQRLLIDHALRHPGTTYTVRSHMNSNGITDVTARSDLEGLVKVRLLFKTLVRKEAQYFAVPDLRKKVYKGSQRD